MIHGRQTLDLKEVQVVDFESEVKAAFVDDLSGLVNVLFTSGKLIKIDSSGEIHSLSNFNEIENVFLDK